jgi:HK97 gp10 family phage protein
MLELDLSAVQKWGGLLAEEAEAIARRIEPAVAAQQAEVLAAVRADAPARTGAVKGSVRTTGRGMSRFVRAGNRKTFYARFLEFGTQKMAARSFVRPNADGSVHAEFEDRIDTALARGPIYD